VISITTFKSDGVRRALGPVFISLCVLGLAALPGLSRAAPKTSTTTTLASSVNPAYVGQGVTVTATVSPSAATGTVTFKDGSTTLGTGTVSNGVATLSTSFSAAATHNLTASYGGSTSYQSSTSAALAETVQAKATSTTTLASSPNPSTSGQSVTLTATVTGTSPTGTVTFNDGSTTLGTATISSGSASLSTALLTAGSHSVTAAYAGDVANNASTSSALTQTVNQAVSATSLSSSANPSSPNQSVTLTAAVTPSTATGAVTFKDGAVTLGTGSLSAGTATYSTSTLAIGSHSLTATYGGDTNDAASTSPALTQVVNPLATTTTLSSSASYVAPGANFTLTATVSPSTATGTVTFKDGSMTLGTGTLSSGSASLTTSATVLGAHSMSAVYGGDANDATSTSSALTLQVRATPTVTMTCPSSQVVGNAITCTIRYTSSAGNVALSNGTASITWNGTTVWSGATYYDGGSVYNNVTIPGSAAVLNTIGAQQLVANYLGDSYDNAASSTPVTVNVTAKSTPTVTMTCPSSQVAGNAISCTINYSSPQGNPAIADHPATITWNGNTVWSGNTYYNGSTVFNNVTIPGSAAVLNTIGAQQLVANYLGDSYDNAASSTPVTVNVTAKSTPTVTMTCPSSQVAGNAISCTINYSSPQGNPAIADHPATITWNGNTVWSGNTYYNGSTVFNNVTIPGSAAVLNTIGAQQLVANYLGDSYDNAASSTPVTVNVTAKSTPTVTMTCPSSQVAGNAISCTINYSSPQGNPAIADHPATITWNGNTVWSGNTYYNGSTVFNNVTIPGSAAVLNTIGAQQLVANYLGDSLDNTASSTPVTVNVTAKSTPTVTMTCPSSQVAGNAISCTINYSSPQGNPAIADHPATITWSGNTVWSGNTYYNGASVFNNVTIPGSATVLNTIGTQQLVANYLGDSYDNAASSTTVTVNVTEKSTPTVTMTCPSSQAEGSPITCTINYSSPQGNPAIADHPATITWNGNTVWSGNTYYNGSTVFNNVTIPGSAAVLNTIGAQQLVANYLGDSYDNAASSTPVTVDVLKRATTSLASSANPSTVGQPVTLTATISPSSAAGTVTFNDGATTLGTGTLSSGVATLSTTFSTIGTHNLTAVYSGDASNGGNTGTLALSVKQPVTVQVTVNPNPVNLNQTTILAATIAGTSPTGTVTFTDETPTTLGTATVSGGVASLTVSYQSGATHTITANYSGDTTNNPGTAMATLTVNATNSWTYQYDAKGNVTSAMAPQGLTTSTAYDALDRPTTVNLPLLSAATQPNSVSMVYDARDALASVKDARSLSTSYTVDGLGNVQSQQSPDTGSTSFTVDASGNVKSLTDAKGKTSTFGYDDIGRLLTITYASGTPTTFTYDGGTTPITGSVGKLTRVTDESGSTSYVYNAAGYLASKTQTIGAKSFTVSYAWSQGKLASITYPGGSQVSYSYDDNGRPNAVTINPVNANGVGVNTGTTLGLLTALTYNAASMPTGWTWADGSTYQLTYDSFSRLSTYPLGKSAGTGVSAGMTRTLGYDNGTRILSYTHAGAAGSLPQLDQSFGYDNQDRLTSALVGNTSIQYGYDNGDNRNSITQGSTQYTYSISSTSNRLTSISNASGTFTPTYDANGRMTSDGVNTYVYSDRGRMSSVITGGGTVSYLYNGLEQRVSKAGPTSLVPSGAAYFVYDEAGHLLGEYDVAGNVLYETIYVGPAPVGVMKTTGSAASSTLAVQLYNVYGDHLGAPRMVTRQADQAIVWRWDSAEPFGASPADQNPSGLGTFVLNQRFPGQVFDAESGLFQNWHREYNAYLGRYTQSDPIGLGGGINTYGYVGGNPLQGVDPRGLSCTAVGNSVTCTYPGGPTFTVPRPPGWPDDISQSSKMHHLYNIRVAGGCVNADELRQKIVRNPTPGTAPNGASPNGTPNDANPPWMEGFVHGIGTYGGDSSSPLNPVLSYTRTFNGQTIVVNVTQPGHTLFPGYVARVVTTTQNGVVVNNLGEGLGPFQSRYSPVAGLINSAWESQSQGLIDQTSQCTCPR
jgi:RHS repeat-associated protein